MRRCEREAEVAGALRAGSLHAELPSELIAHVRGCASCEETERVAQALLGSAAAMRAQHELPAVEHVLRRARLRSQEIALRRATRPLIFMRVLSLGFIAVCAVWFLRFVPAYSEPIAGFGFLATPAGFLGIGFAVLCVAVGSLYLLREGRQGRVFST